MKVVFRVADNLGSRYPMFLGYLTLVYFRENKMGVELKVFFCFGLMVFYFFFIKLGSLYLFKILKILSGFRDFTIRIIF